MTLTKKQQLHYIKKAQEDRKKVSIDCMKIRRDIVMIRAKNKCEYFGCRNTDRLNDHHPKTKGACPHLKYDLDNSLVLCYNHHKGREGAHTDIHFKDKILGKYPGFKAIRTQQWLDLLDLKAQTKQRLDLNMEYLYLVEELKKYESQK